MKGMYDSRYAHDTREVGFTWNELFSEVSPLLISEASESDMRLLFKSLAKKKIDQVFSKGERKIYDDIYVSEMSDSSFGQICVQFKALGYIQLSDKKHSAHQNETFWSLTKYGDFVMTQLVAQRK